MTHLWKSTETYVFDIPSKDRLVDVYWKSAHVRLELYIKWHVPKVTKVRFAEDGLGVFIDVDIPKYPEERPYFTDEDVSTLLKTYMDYANSSLDELMIWLRDITKV